MRRRGARRLPGALRRPAGPASHSRHRRGLHPRRAQHQDLRRDHPREERRRHGAGSPRREGGGAPRRHLVRSSALGRHRSGAPAGERGQAHRGHHPVLRRAVPEHTALRRAGGSIVSEPAKTTYTPRERVVAAYKGEFADRVPAYPIAGCFAGCLEGLSIEEYCTNPTRAARAMLNYYERYQPDIMIAFNDLAKEAEAVGCHVKYSDYVVPSIDRHVLQDDKGRLAKLEVHAVVSALRKSGRLSTIRSCSWFLRTRLRNTQVMCFHATNQLVKRKY